jgi:HAD superfamily hydrolase (TIGR01509 family)
MRDEMTVPAGVLLDMDGTLIDSEPYWIAEEQALVASFGKIWTHEDGLTLIGNSLPVSAQIIRERTGIPLADDEILHRILAGVVARTRAHVPWRPGAELLLSRLHDAGIPTALVTASYRVFASVVMEAAGGALTVMVPGDEVTRAKPDSEPYLLAAAKLGVTADRCVAIEDSPPGIASALASGAKTIGVPCVLPVPPQPGLSRVASLADLDLGLLGRIANGEVVDTLI